MHHNYFILYKISSFIHGFLAKSPFLAKLYLILMSSILRNSPNFPLKKNIQYHIGSYSWPQIDFKARKVNLTADSFIYLIPHVGEFDFKGLFSRNLDYEKEVFLVLKERINNYEAIIEIGSNVGVFTNFFSKTLGKESSSPVFAFEPSRLAYSRLLENIKANNAQNVYPLNIALHEKAGFLDFFEPEGHLTNGSVNSEFASIFSSEVKRTIVPSMCDKQLSELINDRERILMKIDVEGAEEIILKNLENFILSRNTDIVLEVLPTYENALNNIFFLRENYIFFLISEQRLVRKEKFEAHPHYRDYFLSPKKFSSD